MISRPFDTNIEMGDQPRNFILTDHSAPLPRDLSVREVNRAEAERLRKAKEEKRKKRQ